MKASDNLDAITVTGAFGEKPTVKIKAPYAVDKTRTQVLHQGTGTKIPDGGFALSYFYGAVGRTGKDFQENFSDKTPAAFPMSQVVAGFAKGLTGQRIGSRVLIAMPGTDGYDAQGGNPSIGVQVGDTLIFVVDIVGGSVDGPTGKAVKPAAGLPKVTDKDGKPEIAIPAGNPPTSLVSQPLTEGTGDKVKASDTIFVHYRGVSWKTGKVIEDRFDAMDSGSLSSTIPGWQKGLVDKRVGQRMLLVIPPADAYPQGSNNPPVEAGDTLVYVIDILFTTGQG